ncbi:hypothetical protein NIES970_00970 [[Synechococcus] sp. NIES-970]|uniref:diadenylate cyclase CdaA n=1 Tax=Picosynechococcus sp. NKBG15041c TaxID=1407650 RepID=UPI00046371C2|nr:diadenylate cyclase CdaA [Picosynechococcus sp. NKBG15041c]BAW95196.1 hypothetical protein NIES970_00970 [[Synechococcus] sp. NIES-970]
MPDWLFKIADIALTLFLVYLVLFVVRDRVAVRLMRGFLLLVLAHQLAALYGLPYLSALLDKLILVSAVGIATLYQSQVRRILEKLGRGEFIDLLTPSEARGINPENEVLDRIVDSVKDLSQSRTGALILIETTSTPIDQKDFLRPGVPIDAEVSKELLKSIFYDKNPLHDGAVLIRDTRVIAARILFHLSEKTGFRQLGTRHLAARSVTAQLDNCVCVIVSEETGSISLAKRGELNRPLTSSELRELLADYFKSGDRESVTTSLSDFSRRLKSQGKDLLTSLAHLKLPFIKKD